MADNDETVLDGWKKTRSGARAGRGFDYQHRFSTLILVQQWAGLLPTGNLVPEGLEDCVVELPDRDIWIQIKSREQGTFSKGEVKTIFKQARRKASLVNNPKPTQLVAGLEQPCPAVTGYEMDGLFDGRTEKVVVCTAPEEEIVNLLSQNLNIAEIIAEGLMSDLYKLVAESSAVNASLPFERRRRISTTEVECHILERLEAEDPSAINRAFDIRALEPVDFVTPVSEPGFYQGVKVKPGHIASGLVIERPGETQDVVQAFKKRRHLLVTGPSGAGKSALIWLVAHSLTAEFRWYQISAQANAQDADAIIRFVKSRRPKKVSPIGLIFDDVGESNSNLWDILTNQLRSLPDVYILGSVRNEDIALITNQSDTEFFEIRLDSELAQSMWEKLINEGQTKWAYWREPFEQSDGLMLEYVHLLTQGKRLAAVIGEQIRQRERERRYDELAIIRGTAVLCAFGGEVEAKRLFELLQLPPDCAAQALKRLIDEHLVRESRPGVLGGLHALRSKALCDASHDDVSYLRSDSLWQSLAASTNETLPRIIQSVLNETQNEAEDVMLQNLAKALAASDDIEVWAAILTGLGIGTMEQSVASFTEMLEKHGVQRTHWFLASMFSDASIDVPELSGFENLKPMRNAVIAFRALPKRDLRDECLQMLPEGTQAPVCPDIRQANLLLSSLVPITGGDPIQISFAPDFSGSGEQNIHDVAALLSTAYLIEPDLAIDFVVAFGGEQTLFTWFHSQIPWVTVPIIEPQGTHGRTVRANRFFVAESHQTDAHKTLCDICETLIAISPMSNAAASDAIGLSGQPIAINGLSDWSKNIPRAHLPPKARVAWNIVFRQILLARAAEHSLTDYTHEMADHVRRTEKIFRLFSEQWIKGWRISNKDKLAAEINEIMDHVNGLIYAKPKTLASSMTSTTSDTEEDDRLGSLLASVLDNLVPRMCKIPPESDAKAAAGFTSGLAAQAREHGRSEIWRTTPSPPLDELAALAERLDDVACILHEIAHDDTVRAIKNLRKAARKGRLGKAIRATAGRCRLLAKQRFHRRLRALENALKAQGLTARCRTRPVNDADSIDWPAVEVAILIKITDSETDWDYLEYGLAIGKKQLAQDWRFCVVPVINNQVIADLAFISSSQGPLLDVEFTHKWKAHIDLPFFFSKISNAFDTAVSACTQISAIISYRDLKTLHPVEEEVLLKARDDFEYNWKIVDTFIEKTEQELFDEALAYLESIWNQVVSEIESIETGQMVDNPFCHVMADVKNEKVIELGVARMLLRQAECFTAVSE